MPAQRKREGELQRPRSRKGAGSAADVSKGEMRKVTIPHADPSWGPVARRIYDGLRTSGQADFFQNSDWAMAYFMCGEVDAYLSTGKHSAMMLSSILSGLERLLLTEADRRKARIELEAPVEDTTSHAELAIAEYQEALKRA